MEKNKKILVYAENPESSAYKALEKMIENVFKDPRIKLSARLEEELRTEEFGVVINTTKNPCRYRVEALAKAINREKKYIFGPYFLIEEASNPSTLMKDIGVIAANYFRIVENSRGYDS
jgi:hypothetical protein